jgi:hypothetical protein
MKKIILTIAALALSAAAFAQDREIDLEELDSFNKIELSKSGAHVETDLSFAFPMHFGWTTLTNINYKGTWATGTQSNFLDFKTGKNFVYGLQLVGMDIRYGALNVNLGLRWTFMDFTFKDYKTSIKPSGNSFVPYYIDEENPSYNYRKSKIHATYFGVPLRLSLNFGKATIYGGASIELLVNGFAKYKQPKVKTQMKELFNPIRATVEGGFSYGNLGVFVQYGLTPLFPADLSDARTLTFGLLLGL